MNTLKWRLIRFKYRFNKHIDRKLSSFHKTDFTFGQSWRMVIVFVMLYIIGATFMNKYAILNHVTVVTGKYMVLNFIAMELLPVVIVGLLFGIVSKYRHGHRNFFEDLTLEIKKWVMRFLKDLWANKWLILGMTVAILIGEIVINRVSTDLFLNGQTASNKNNMKIVKLMRQSAWMLFGTDIIAPIAEELVFRAWLPKMGNHVMSKAWGGRASNFTYWFTALVSAIIFAGMHMQGQTMLMSGSYIFLALAFQLIMKRSHSLTAPVTVHAGNNIIVTVISLI